MIRQGGARLPLGPRQDLPGDRLRVSPGSRTERNRGRGGQAGGPGGHAAPARPRRAPGEPDLHPLRLPHQGLREVLERKLRIDGIRHEALILKDSLGQLRKGRVRAIKEQFGYKLPVLLSARAGLGRACRETLFGDDAEVDALVYSLYADVVSGRVGADAVARIMAAAGAYPDAIRRTLEAIDAVPTADAVERIFIRVEKRRPPAVFLPWGPAACGLLLVAGRAGAPWRGPHRRRGRRPRAGGRRPGTRPRPMGDGRAHPGHRSPRARGSRGAGDRGGPRAPPRPRGARCRSWGAAAPAAPKGPVQGADYVQLVRGWRDRG